MSAWARKLRQQQDRQAVVGYALLKPHHRTLNPYDAGKDPGRRAVRNPNGTWADDEVEQ
jgi:hypothetical protein